MRSAHPGLQRAEDVFDGLTSFPCRFVFFWRARRATVRGKNGKGDGRVAHRQGFDLTFLPKDRAAGGQRVARWIATPIVTSFSITSACSGSDETSDWTLV